MAFIGVSASPAHAAVWWTDQQWGQRDNGGYTWANSYSNWDVWADHNHEIMLWMNWNGPVGPIGTYQSDASAGTVDILRWIARQGWISWSELIGDVQFGVSYG